MILFLALLVGQLPCVDFITWSNVWCTMGGPGVPSPDWDLNFDGSFDLLDFAITQNLATNVGGFIGHDEPCTGICTPD